MLEKKKIFNFFYLIIQVDNKNRRYKFINLNLRFCYINNPFLSIPSTFMLRPKKSIFQKTLQKHKLNNNCGQTTDQIKTRRSYFKMNKNNNNLSSIIKQLQKNVKQLKNYHQSLHKTKSTNKLKRTTSLNQLHNNRISSTNPKTHNTKSHLIKKNVTNKSNLQQKVAQMKSNLQNNQAYKKHCIQSTISKFNNNQNGSTMLSIHNYDVQEIKKAYQTMYGKQNSNIIDLYHFFRKNIQKSTRILYGGSTDLQHPNNCLYKSNYLQNHNYLHGSTNLQNNNCQPSQQTQYLNNNNNIKFSQLFHTKSLNKFPNVIIEQNIVDSSNNGEFGNKSENFYKKTVKQNRMMQQIFKNGCPDLANVYDFVKKRRVSLKSYLNTNKCKQNGTKSTMTKSKEAIFFRNDKDNLYCNKNNQNKQTVVQEQNKQNVQSNGQTYSIYQKQTSKDLLPTYRNQETSPILQNQPNNQILSIKHSPADRKKSTNQLDDQIISNTKYLRSKSSKKSLINSNKIVKSSNKKSKQKHIDLDQNISDQQVNQFAEYITQYIPKEKPSNQILSRKQKHFERIFTQDFFKEMEMSKNQKYTKNYNQIKQRNSFFDDISQIINESQNSQMKKDIKKGNMPNQQNGQNSLDGCSISVKSSSRIIQLDFIPLDL